MNKVRESVKLSSSAVWRHMDCCNYIYQSLESLLSPTLG